MRHPTHIRLLAVVVGLTALAALATRGFAADEPSRELARQLQSWYEGVAGPGNHLKILIQSAGA
ncbi:MAG: hypothetical protein ABJC61_09165 [Acidobacteriota bacterium]